MADTTMGRLTRIWETPSNFIEWATTVDHQRIGIRYMITAFFVFLVGGSDAELIRTQLAIPGNNLVSPELYNQLFTMHGTVMIFLFITPILFGFGNFLIPLQIGARDMAFPRLNAFGYWVYALSVTFLYTSVLLGIAPHGGWFNYVPYADSTWSPGYNIDFYSPGLTFLSIASTAGAINFIVTICKLRAPGMSINRMPLFTWGILVTSFMVIFALPALTVANTLLELDRKVGTHFYDPAGGGNPLLWQHLVWQHLFWSSYFYLASGAPVWPPDGIKPPDLVGPIIGTVLLLSSSAPIIGGERSIKRGDRRGLLSGWAIAWVLAAVFIGLQIHEYTKEEFSIRTNQYGSLFFTVTGLHVVHVTIALCMNLFVVAQVLAGHITKKRHLSVETAGIYWHFVGVVWIVVFTSLYVIPHFL